MSVLNGATPASCNGLARGNFLVRDRQRLIKLRFLFGRSRAIWDSIGESAAARGWEYCSLEEAGGLANIFRIRSMGGRRCNSWMRYENMLLR